VLIDRRWRSSTLHVQPFSGPDSDNDHYAEVAKDRERLSVDKRAAQKLHMERLNLKNLYDVNLGKSISLKSEKRL
jgi:hypothetical protein